MISHGLAYFLKERLMDASDAYSVNVCAKCGLFAQRLVKRSNKSKASLNDVYYCPVCNNTNNIVETNMPYAFKLLIQELLSMNIYPKIIFNESKFD